MAKKPSVTRMPRIQKEMLACLQCGYCIDVCEAHAQTPWESVTPRGKIYYLTQLDKKNFIDRILNRKVRADGDLVDAIYKCTGCGNCEAVCHANLELVSFWEKIRAWLVENGVGPLPKHTELIEKIATKGNPYGEEPDDRDAWWPSDINREAVPDVVMFAGCTGSYRMKDIPRAGVRVLDRAGVKQNCLGSDEICCTSPALRTGELGLTRGAATTVVSKADAMGAKDMVMTCAGCYKTITSDFGNHYSRAGQQVYHFTQYMEKLIAEKKLTFNNPINAKVTYHDPCHLGRHSGVFDAPRNVLKRIKGVELVEMEKNRENSRCCGAGGGYRSAFTDFAVNIAAERIKDAEDVGANIIATACPFCVLNLTAGAKKIKSKVKVMDISEMLLKVTAPPEPREEPAAVPAAGDAVRIAAEAAAARAAAEAAAAASATDAGEYIYTEDGERVAVYEDDKDVFADETARDSGELKLRRRLWMRGYRYRRSYGNERINVAFPKTKVAVFVDDRGESGAADDTLRGKGWTVLRFKDGSITDAGKEADEVIAAIKSAEAEEEKKKQAEHEADIAEYSSVIPESADETDDDVLGDETAYDTGELRLRRKLWKKGYRYRRHYGRRNITIAYPKSKVAVFVTQEIRGPDLDIDDSLRAIGWTVLRFKDGDITDAEKESEKVIAALKRIEDERIAAEEKRAAERAQAEEREKREAALAALEEEMRSAGETELEYDEDPEVIAEEREDDPGELKLRRRLWRRGYRYRKVYGKERVTIAFLRAKVGVFVDDTEGPGAYDAYLTKKGWNIIRFKESDITDARKEAEEVIAAIEKAGYVAEEAHEEIDDDVTKEERPDDPADLKIRRKLWKRGYRYRKQYGSKKITIAFLRAKVAVLVGGKAAAKEKDTDESLKVAGWTVLRFREASVKDGQKEADKIIAVVEKNLNSLMNEDIPKKTKVKVDEELFADEADDDPADLKLRRILWRNAYRYRKRYGREKITVAFRRAKVGAFVCKDAYRRKGDEQLVKRGWTIMRFKEASITDAKKEAAKVMAAVDRNLYLLSKGIIPEGANITSSDVLDQEIEENTPEYRLRMTLWKDNRYRRNYGEHEINIAYPAAKVAVFVDDTGEKRASDYVLEDDNWVVLRFKGPNITDGKKEAEKVIEAIDRNKNLLEELDFEEGGAEDEEDLSYLLDDTPEGRVRRAVWNKRVRYRRNYSKYKIDMAFVKFKVAVFMDSDGKRKSVDDVLDKKGWKVVRIKVPNITDGKEEADRIYKVVKEAKKAARKKKKKKKKKTATAKKK